MNIMDVHHALNTVYGAAHDMANFLEEAKIEFDIQYIAGNYMKLEDSYVLQAYPIPIVFIKKKGSIGFNLDGYFFEFMVKKQSAMALDVEALSSTYAIDIYGATNEDDDYYKIGMSNAAYKARIEKSKENGFGLSFYMHCFNGDAASLYEAFMTCYYHVIQGTQSQSF